MQATSNPVQQSVLECELAEMVRYASCCTCKRAQLLLHFGEVLMSKNSILLSCDNCSTCDSEQSQRTIDVTKEAKILFQTVQETQCTSANNLVLILRGSKNRSGSSLDPLSRLLLRFERKGLTFTYIHVQISTARLTCNIRKSTLIKMRIIDNTQC